MPLGCGIRKEAGDRSRELAIRGPTAAGPAQFEVRTRYESGSILAVGGLHSPPVMVYRLVWGKTNPAAALPDIPVRETDTEIMVNNGVLELTWDREFGSPTRVAVVEGGAAREIATGDGDGVYLIDNQDRRAVLCGENGELQWQVETAGPVAWSAL